MASTRAKHGTTGSRLCGRSGEGGWQRADDYAAPGDRAHAMPAVEATRVVGWCGLARQAHHVDVGVVAVERKAGGKRGREGGMREPLRSRSRSGVAVMHEFFS
jgi:hypothetical protein